MVPGPHRTGQDRHPSGSHALSVDGQATLLVRAVATFKCMKPLWTKRQPGILRSLFLCKRMMSSTLRLRKTAWGWVWQHRHMVSQLPYKQSTSYISLNVLISLQKKTVRKGQSFNRWQWKMPDLPVMEYVWVLESRARVPVALYRGVWDPHPKNG